MEAIKVSVVIPVYNEELFLDRTLNSVLAQQEVAEVILVDDQSTDNSLEICKSWKKKDQRVSVLSNIGIKGAGGAINTGLHQVTQNYVAILGADDYFLEERFADDSRLFEKYPEVEAISHSIKIITSDTKNYDGLNAHFVHGQNSGSKLDNTLFIKPDNLKLKQHFPITGLTFKTTILDKVGYFDETLKQAQDIDFVLRMKLFCPILTATFDKPVAVYFRHENNTTRNMTEAVFYRRLTAKKHFAIAVKNKLPINITWKYFKDFMEYDFLWLFRKNIFGKKLIKALLLPIFIYRINTESQVLYDCDRKILN
ncbi:MAG: glycosyltransferase family 2 protein [Chitinophagales bacterium]|nr:glycosyltransferase family 2 protein [Chitinophagales bacterium]